MSHPLKSMSDIQIQTARFSIDFKRNQAQIISLIWKRNALNAIGKAFQTVDICALRFWQELHIKHKLRQHYQAVKASTSFGFSLIK